jgi:adenine-specific DNA-methyltransferase
MTQFQPSLFQNISPLIPTEGIKYAGSKLKLLSRILELVDSVKPRVVFDGFAGTTRVSQALAHAGYTVIANDLAIWSKVFATCYLLNDKSKDHYIQLINYLNGLEGEQGWYSEHYGGNANGGCAIQSDGLKRPWQLHVTQRLDAIRDAIESLDLDEVEKCVALTSLILALDKVDNTIGHYASYLKDWSPRSYNLLKLEVPQMIPRKHEHLVLNEDIFSTIAHVEADLAYFDPPYGSNNEKMPPSRIRYAAYYHLWKTICLNDKPELFGNARRRKDSSDTEVPNPFEDFRRNIDTGRFVAVEAIEKLIKNVNVEYVLLSYSSGGRATATELHEILENHGQILRVAKVNYKKNVMADMKWTNEWVQEAEEQHQEFLFLIRK